MLCERFWSKVERLADDECWLWKAAKHPKGYGRYFVSPALGVKRAHRVAYEDAFGAIPDGLEACHKCDNPGCVNPAHMFIGPHIENMRDMYAKGRHNIKDKLRGSDNGNSRLTEDAVRDILRREAASSEYARRYNVSAVTVQSIWRRKTWAHIT